MKSNAKESSDMSHVKQAAPSVEIPDIAPRAAAQPAYRSRREEMIAEGKRRWEALEWEESKLVKGKFVYNECPTGLFKFSYAKFGPEITTYEMLDGETYEIPLAVARHLNTNCSYDSYKWYKTEKGLPRTKVDQKIRRTSFLSTDFF